MYSIFLPQGVEIKLIFALWEAVSAIFKIAIFGHEIWALAKVTEVAHITFFLRQGVEIDLHSTGSGFRYTG